MSINLPIHGIIKELGKRGSAEETKQNNEEPSLIAGSISSPIVVRGVCRTAGSDQRDTHFDRAFTDQGVNFVEVDRNIHALPWTETIPTQKG